VGRVACEKRIDWLRAVLDALPEVRLAVVGDGPARVELEHLFGDGRTVFTGYLRGADLAGAYASADLFALPSANETFGNVVLEAMASGLPVVAAGAGGPLDVIRHAETGLLFAPEDKGALVSAVGQVLSDAALASRLERAARAEAEGRSWDAKFDELLSHYERVAGRVGLLQAA
jgi:glycosyltransferase involved in cell wall biosynthesis